MAICQVKRPHESTDCLTSSLISLSPFFTDSPIQICSGVGSESSFFFFFLLKRPDTEPDAETGLVGRGGEAAAGGGEGEEEAD